MKVPVFGGVEGKRTHTFFAATFFSPCLTCSLPCSCFPSFHDHAFQMSKHMSKTKVATKAESRQTNGVGHDLSHYIVGKRGPICTAPFHEICSQAHSCCESCFPKCDLILIQTHEHMCATHTSARNLVLLSVCSCTDQNARRDEPCAILWTTH